jgi:hypothetical protein
MAISVHVDSANLVVRCSGSAILYTFTRTVSVALVDIASASAVPYDSTLTGTRGFRRLGTFVPGRVAVGWFSRRDRKGSKDWWFVFRPKEVLVVETRIARPSRLVLQTDQCHELAAQLQHL